MLGQQCAGPDVVYKIADVSSSCNKTKPFLYLSVCHSRFCLKMFYYFELRKRFLFSFSFSFPFCRHYNKSEKNIVLLCLMLNGFRGEIYKTLYIKFTDVY